MVTNCTHCPLRKLDIFESLTADSISFLQRFKSGELKVDAGTPLLMEGSNSPQLFTALKGMGVRYKLLPNGRRQVVNFVLPGDFVGLQAGVMGEMKHSVEATTPMVLCVFDRSELWTLFKTQPERAFDLTWAAAMEEHFLGEALTSIGQMSAMERIAWGLVRFHGRCENLGLIDGTKCPFPYRQQDLADALGLSLVHTNKTLMKLRDRQILSINDGILQIMDIEEAKTVALLPIDLPGRRPLI
ncbi:Crp/Fnr family transcriptional regulator [Jannaschia pagri]|uniref:Crp/Fnr family transcriptional regulator n=1 Tax=Jannaschia pagri TaxID=2829797 RepID=A0ABQ4NN75_9RHOB|nr:MULTISPECIES: Crp/Fnr family transcriptional regulator [unclassified Jannaschia]GIT92036.1 Crp/Fnr family transcriptional regulator [Jannaschia sp. AI_61]GIT95870.1 Crp/Fnr family transcriptional regulator [Jannaschia sp. AI_62]